MCIMPHYRLEDPKKVISRASTVPMTGRKARSCEIIDNVRDIPKATLMSPSGQLQSRLMAGTLPSCSV